ALQSLCELPSALRLCHGGGRRARQAEAQISGGAVRHALREVAVSAAGRAVSQARLQLRNLRLHRRGHERHRLGRTHETSQGEAAAGVQNRIAVPASLLSLPFPADPRIVETNAACGSKEKGFWIAPLSRFPPPGGRGGAPPPPLRSGSGKAPAQSRTLHAFWAGKENHWTGLRPGPRIRRLSFLDVGPGGSPPPGPTPPSPASSPFHSI